MKLFAIASAFIAFVFCLMGGLVLLHSIGFDLFVDKDNALYAGVGLYFIGKAVFVGAMILLVFFRG
jgi:hypothetical protein